MFCSVTYDGDGNRVKSVIGTGTTLFVQFYRSSSGYQLRMRAYDSVLANYVNTPYVTITDAQHALELDWGADGHATFWIDGVQQGSLTGLNNSTYRMDSIRLGAPYISGSLSGTYYLDAFESRRSSYIGPLAQAPSGSPSLAVVPNLVPVAYHPPSSQPSQALTVADASALLSTTNVSFVYDGDGNRVAQTLNGVTTYFIGGHYEVTGSIVTKYYFAGAQRVAMRKYTIPTSMAVEYFLGDHLGSTSVTTDSNGAKISEIRYKPWGEIRFTWTSGVTSTPSYKLAKYLYTGQFSYMDDPTTSGVTEGFGLLFYVSRFYDPALGRFTSADSIVPGGVQGLDRYAYVNNSPINFTDPSGHQCVPKDECGNIGSTTTSYSFDLQFGISFDGDWSEGNQGLVRDGVQAVARAFYREYRMECRHGLADQCEVYSSAQLFRVVYDTNATDRLVFQWGDCPECNGSGGYTYSPHRIAFASLPQSFYPSGIKTPEMAYRQGVNNVVHELGHAFALLWAHDGGYDNSGPYGTGIIPGELVDNDGFFLYPQPEGASLTWRQHPCIAPEDNCSHEVFADMFLGWTYGAWANNREGQERSNFMMQHMPAWIVSLVP